MTRGRQDQHPDQQAMGAAPAAGPLEGRFCAPGDKSISHRALIFGALAEGETRIEGLLEGDDVLRTAAAMRLLGASVERDLTEAGPRWRVEGAPWRSPDRPLYFGNAGTGCRLVMGAVAGQGGAAGAAMEASFEGDASLRARPMDRILDPLGMMGAAAKSQDGRLPCHLRAETLRAIEYTLPKPSAQIKSAILLAALGAEGETVIHEPEICRDHSERMLKAFGGAISINDRPEGGRSLRIPGGQHLTACDIDVPGDPSSAAFLVAAALLCEGSDLTVENVLLNPMRTGFFQTLLEMGADLVFENRREQAGEEVGDIRVRHRPLRGVDVPAARAPSMIDEYPILAVVASCAQGETYMAGIEEMRIKESDRIAAMEAGLNANGVATTSGPDWLRVQGGKVPGGRRVVTHHDHRIAMSFLVLGLAAQKAVEIDDPSMIATSFPNFFDLMAEAGAQIAPV